MGHILQNFMLKKFVIQLIMYNNIKHMYKPINISQQLAPVIQLQTLCAIDYIQTSLYLHIK